MYPITQWLRTYVEDEKSENPYASMLNTSRSFGKSSFLIDTLSHKSSMKKPAVYSIVALNKQIGAT